MTRGRYTPGVLSLVAVLSMQTSCGPVGPPANADDRLRARNEGYSLLYKLVSDESGVSKLLIVKHPDDAVATEIKAISKYFAEQKETLDSFQKRDPQLDYTLQSLP